MVAPYPNPIYPWDVWNAYKNLDVELDDGRKFKISVNKYKCSNPNFGGTVEEEKIKDAFLGASDWKIHKEAGGAVPYVGVFCGKGSPEQIELTLSLIWRYRQAFIKTHKHSKGVYAECVKAFTDNEDDPQAALQAFTNRCIGLDCNGFVGNWVIKADPHSKQGPSTRPKDYFGSKRAKLRKNPEDISDFDIVVWKHMQHIACLDWLTVNDKRLLVQSTAGGPQWSENRLEPKSEKGLYGILPEGPVHSPVYIFGFGIYE